LAASKPQNLIERAIPLLLLAVVLAGAVLFIYTRFGTVMIDVGGQGSPQQIYFGTEYRARDVSRFVIPIEAVAAVFFVVIALVFVCLGQVMGRAFNRLPDRLAAYTLNIGHQGMVRVAKSGAGYLLPHLLNRDAGGAPFADVLIIGAGSGNDVDAALRQGAAHVDAVEIDPAIYDIGRNDHPDHPYGDP